MQDRKSLTWKWQIRLNRISFKKLNIMVHQSRIPRNLAQAEQSFCLAKFLRGKR